MRRLPLGENITIDDVADFVSGKAMPFLPRSARKRMMDSLDVVRKIASGDDAVYGINTGFGKLAQTRINAGELAKLQENLILSHACGVGEPFHDDVVRLIMFLRANVLAKGFSGVRPELVEQLIKMLEVGVLPIIPEQGSVGASGDLAPLAHLALVMIGKGRARFQGKEMAGASALKKAGIKPVKLEAKEGLALINGTQAMTAVALLVILRSRYLLTLADVVGSLTIEGDRASDVPFMQEIQTLRPHPGQLKTAVNIRRMLKGSKNISSHKQCGRVQDPYSIRCIPQVHGASKDAMQFVMDVVVRELNSVTDNPVIFKGEVFSGGNFHGQPIAIAMDLAAVAMAELADISERRIFLLTSPLNDELPYPFLTPEPGLNSGFMVPHVTAAALVSENKILCHPASVDSIATSGGQEDHVSMGMAAANRTLEILENVETVLAIELIAAAQAIDLRREKYPLGKGTRVAYDVIRQKIPFLKKDMEMKPLLDMALDIAPSVLLAAQEAAGGLEV